MVLLVAIIFVASAIMTGCSAAQRKSAEISREADNFETPRKLTIINTRTDKIILEFTGTFSVQSSDGAIDILCAIGDDQYEKHFFTLNEWTIYIVEDVNNQDIKLYDKIVKYYPENEE
jgi:heme/copper-type cytochrome/quinol oxidase subunit 2